ncbi:hypothetical protein ACJMK2_005162 [Sinanodonta woodiana]|uniref:Macro domain-containing protein n=1 Tax=Sinanodonta woodiana TaxID=1069815 RepID=A0ABD3VP87_SINWO
MADISLDTEFDSLSIRSATSTYSSFSIISSRSRTAFIDHFEIFRKEPEIIQFCFNKEGTEKSSQDSRLEELGLDPFICGYLGREHTPKEKPGTARLKFLEDLQKKCHARPSILDHGRIISIQYSGRWSTDTEMATRRAQVVELFKDTEGVRSYKASFPEKQENIGIVKRKLNHHLKERHVVAYALSDPEQVTEIGFAYERGPNDYIDTSDNEEKHDFVEKLANDINKQKIIWKLKTFKDQQMEVLKVRHKWWKNVLVDIQTNNNTVQLCGLQEDVNKVFCDIEKALLPAAIDIINLNDEEAQLYQSNTVKKFVKKNIESLCGQQCLDWLVDENVVRIIGPNEGTVSRLVECLKECIKSQTFDKVPEKVLSLQAWTKQLENLQNSYKKKLLIKCHKSTIKVTSTSDIHETVVMMVNNYLRRYTPSSSTIQSNRYKLDFFVRNHQEALEEYFRDEIFQITRPSEHEIQVYGTKKAYDDVSRVIDNSVIKLFWVARQNVIDLFQHEEGNQLMNKVRTESACLVHKGQQSIDLQFFKGNIEEQKVDVIVNSAAPDLKLDKGQVAKSLSGTAGPELEQDIQSQFPKGVSEREVLKGGPGKLHCKSVYHVVLPMQITEKKDVADVVGTLMKECLEMAIKDKYESIAFPVFGTGTLDYPPDVVLNTMYDVVVNFALKNAMEAITVKKIMILLFPENARVLEAYHVIEQERINRINDCTASHKKLLTEPDSLLKFFIVITSDSMQNIEKAVAQMKEHLP